MPGGDLRSAGAQHQPQGQHDCGRLTMLISLAGNAPHKTALDNLARNKRICVMYANFKAQRDGVLESGFLRFFCSVEPARERVYS